ncbi:PREDICTED: epithelial-stromal interaction protein 1 isoform X3 [Chinchilla lanigera]|uniref:epithelial-stromal interaction protein 1 isoform X3 n=1 Tax=Chinchilla lanigera TaxID=34839 RepID=UPI000696C3CE|nr:PREDICTED: epithelial-stromal interaction protein 1 isoform X3 [Chinchilla lanigera]
MYARGAAMGSGARLVPARDPGAPGPRGSQSRGLEAAGPGAPARASLGPSDPRSTRAYTLIAPNETRRHQIQRIAEQELASLEKWKEQNRAKSVYLLPRQLGGSQSESEVRQKQQLQLMQSKYQQKLKREECIRIKKEAEEAELQKMKAIQREKDKLPEPAQQLHKGENAKTQQTEHKRVNNAFLDRLQGRSQPGGPEQSGGHRNMNSRNGWGK